MENVDLACLEMSCPENMGLSDQVSAGRPVKPVDSDLFISDDMTSLTLPAGKRSREKLIEFSSGSLGYVNIYV
jgi:hypothetical protein